MSSNTTILRFLTALFTLPARLLEVELHRRERLANRALLHFMTERQLEDIGLPRGLIDTAVATGARSVADAEAHLDRMLRQQDRRRLRSRHPFPTAARRA